MICDLTHYIKSGYKTTGDGVYYNSPTIEKYIKLCVCFHSAQWVCTLWLRCTKMCLHLFSDSAGYHEQISPRLSSNAVTPVWMEEMRYKGMETWSANDGAIIAYWKRPERAVCPLSKGKTLLTSIIFSEPSGQRDWFNLKWQDWVKWLTFDILNIWGVMR